MKQVLAALALAGFVAGCNTSPEEMGSSGVDSGTVSGSATVDSGTTSTNGTNTVIQGTTTNDTQNGTSTLPQQGTSPEQGTTPQQGTPNNSQSGTEPNGSR